MACPDDPRTATTSPSLQRDCRAVVLAGGGSRRFGSDKLDLMIDGSTVLERVVEAVRFVTGDITVVGRTHPGHRALSDPEPRRGPLSAISHALGTPVDGAVLVVGGDHPLVRPHLLTLVVDALGDHDAAVPLDRDGHPQPLVAAYGASLGPRMSSAVDDGRYGLIRFLETVDVDWIQPARWESVDPAAHSFIDIDTVEDLQQVEALLDAVDRTD